MEGRNVRRGEVYLVDLAAQGGRLRKTRPALVVQNDVGNRLSSETIIVAIRDVHGGRPLPTFVPVARETGGLAKDSVIDAGHLHTIGQDALRNRLGTLPMAVMEQVDRALHVSLGLRK